MGNAGPDKAPKSTWTSYEDGYSFNTSSAHRKPAPEVGAPSISWHTGFWKPDAVDLGGSECSSFARHDLWIFEIERLILAIYDHLFDEWLRGWVNGVPGWKKPKVSNLQQPSFYSPAFREKDILYLLRRAYQWTAVPSQHSGSVQMGWRVLGSTPLFHQLHSSLKTGEASRGDHETHLGLFVDEASAKGSNSHVNLCIDSECLTNEEVVHIDAAWRSIPLDIRFEVNSENFAMTSIIDFSRLRQTVQYPRPRREGLGEFDETSTQVQQLRENLFNLIRITNQRKRDIDSAGTDATFKDSAIRLLKAHSEFLYFGIWRQLDDQLYKPSFISGGSPRLGKRFVDLRNLSLQLSYEDPNEIWNPWKHTESGLVKSRWKDYSLRRTIDGFQFKSSNQVSDFGTARETGMPPEQANDIEWVDTIHPVLLALEPDEAVNQQASDPVEYTFTRVCNDRCIFGSGFGPQLAFDDKQGIQRPQTYVLLFGFDEHRQMGRLLHRIHTLGILRNSAIHDLRKIRHLYMPQMHDLEMDLSDLQDDLKQKFNYVYGSESSRFGSRKIDKSIGRKLARVHDRLCKLDGVSEPLSNQSMGGNFGWLSWRSKYYRERFDHLAEALNSSQIEGYQPYRMFMDHRLERADNAVRIAADHFAQLREKERILRREWASLKSEEHQREIQGLQSAGEVLFFVVLLPHYGTEVLKTILDKASWPEERITAWLICLVIFILLFPRQKALMYLAQDFYEETSASLRWFWSRLTRGSIIVFRWMSWGFQRAIELNLKSNERKANIDS